MADTKFRLTGNLVHNLNTMDAKNKAAVVAAANYVAPEAQSYMKSNAPWTDRTGNARNGLSTKVVVSAKSVAIVLYHKVPYGVYLETRWNGKWGIIRDTMAAVGPRFVEVVGRMLFR